MSTTINNEINRVVIDESGGITVEPEINRVVIGVDNVGGGNGGGLVAHLKANEVPMMGPSGNLVYSGVSIEPDGVVRIPENTLGFGEPLTLGAATGFGLIHNRVTDASFVLLDAYTSSTTGSSRPNHNFISTPEFKVFQSDKSTVITDNPLTFEYDTQYDGATFSLTFEASAPMTNVKIEIIDRKTGIEFKHLPSRVAWDDDTVSGMNFRAGANTVDFFSDKPDDPANGIFNIGFTPLILDSGWQLTVIIKADNVAVLGSAAKIPAISGIQGITSFRGLAYQDELSSNAEFIELPEVYNNLTSTEWLTVMQDKATGMNSAYFVCKGLGSTFKNIDLTFHPLSTYWATSFVVYDPVTGAWAQRVSFATDSDWADNARTFQRAGSTAQIAMVSGFRKQAFISDISSGHLSIGANFVGIYNTLQDLKDAIAAPANNYQAIVISPSEKYYHGVGNAWVELAPVGSIHPNYLGVYDNVNDLKIAQPNSNENDIAIVGTINKVFYIKGVSDWQSIESSDLPSLISRMASAEGNIITLQSDVSALQGTVSGLSAGVAAVGLDKDGKLVVTHADGTKQIIALPDSPSSDLVNRIATAEATLQAQGVDINKLKIEYGSADIKLKELNSIYTYSGTGTPIYPIRPQSAYFITMRDTVPRKTDILTPAPIGGFNGTPILHIINKNPLTDIDVTPTPGKTINGAATGKVLQGTFAVFVLDGTNWALVQTGSLSDQGFALSASEVSNAIDNGTAPDSGSIKLLTPGWWFIPADSKNITGRPSTSTGDVTILRQNVTEGSKTSFAVIMAFANDAVNSPAMFAQYRNGGDWSDWFQVSGSADLTAILKSVQDLKTGNLVLIQKLQNLQTQVGNIYAPSKLAFDSAVNSLIDAKIKNSQGDAGKLPDGIPKIYAYYGSNVVSSLGDPGVFSSTSGVIHLSKADTDGKRIFIAIPNDANQSEDVFGISVDDSIAAKWQARDNIYDGKAFRTFYSSVGYYARKNKVQVKFGSGE